MIYNIREKSMYHLQQYKIWVLNPNHSIKIRDYTNFFAKVLANFLCLKLGPINKQISIRNKKCNISFAKALPGFGTINLGPIDKQKSITNPQPSNSVQLYQWIPGHDFRRFQWLPNLFGPLCKKWAHNYTTWNSMQCINVQPIAIR